MPATALAMVSSVQGRCLTRWAALQLTSSCDQLNTVSIYYAWLCPPVCVVNRFQNQEPSQSSSRDSRRMTGTLVGGMGPNSVQIIETYSQGMASYKGFSTPVRSGMLVSSSTSSQCLVLRRGRMHDMYAPSVLTSRHPCKLQMSGCWSTLTMSSGSPNSLLVMESICTRS